METDDALRALGRYSKWQVRLYLMYAVGFGIPFAWILMSVIFIADMPDHHCRLAAGENMSNSIPTEMRYGMQLPAQCTRYVNSSVSNDTMPCDRGWQYSEASGYDSTIVTEWDLVCSRSSLTEMMMSVGTIGTVLGCLFFTRLSDVIGRKPVFMGSMWVYVVVAIVRAFSPTFTFFTVMSVVEGFFQQGMVTSVSVLCIELFPTEQRTFAGIAINFFWVLGYMTLTPIAYLIRNWRHLMLAITAPLTLTVIFYWTLYESIPWLVANNKKNEANKIMKIAARTNKVKIPDPVFKLSPEEQAAMHEQVSCCTKMSRTWQKFKKPTSDQEEQYQVELSQIYRHPTIRLYLLVYVYIWFVNNFVYSGLSLTVTMLAGNRYLNFFLYGLVEIPAYGIAWVLLAKFGRKVSMIVFHIIAGVGLLLTVILNTELCRDVVWLKITLYCIGKFGISASFGSLFVSTPEAFPTNIRNTAIGICMFATRLTQFVTPFVRVWTRNDPYSPPLVMGAMALLAAAVALLLPETRWAPLPETIEDLENLKKYSKKAHRSQQHDNNKHANNRDNNNEQEMMLWKEKEDEANDKP